MVSHKKLSTGIACSFAAFFILYCNALSLRFFGFGYQFGLGFIFNSAWILFGMTYPIWLLCNDKPPKYKTWIQFFFFCLVMGVVSIFILTIIVPLFSFILYFLIFILGDNTIVMMQHTNILIPVMLSVGVYYILEQKISTQGILRNILAYIVFARFVVSDSGYEISTLMPTAHVTALELFLAGGILAIQIIGTEQKSSKKTILMQEILVLIVTIVLFNSTQYLKENYSVGSNAKYLTTTNFESDLSIINEFTSEENIEKLKVALERNPFWRVRASRYDKRYEAVRRRKIEDRYVDIPGYVRSDEDNILQVEIRVKNNGATYPIPTESRPWLPPAVIVETDSRDHSIPVFVSSNTIETSGIAHAVIENEKLRISFIEYSKKDFGSSLRDGMDTITSEIKDALHSSIQVSVDPQGFNPVPGKCSFYKNLDGDKVDIYGNLNTGEPGNISAIINGNSQYESQRIGWSDNATELFYYGEQAYARDTKIIVELGFTSDREKLSSNHKTIMKCKEIR